MRPRKIAATVRYLPWRGSQAAIMFLESNICCVSSGTLKALYCWLPLDVRGANPGMKKWRRGKGTMLTASFRRSAFSWPGNRRHVVMPDMVAETRWFKSPYVGVDNFSVRKQMSYRASLSIQNVSSVFSTSWWTDRVALYGSTTVSDTWTINDNVNHFITHYIQQNGINSPGKKLRLAKVIDVPVDNICFSHKENFGYLH